MIKEEDDWNLKDKEVNCMDKNTDEDFISVRDIETLRQKLIEDFIKRVEWICDSFPCTGENFRDSITELINKRFGVEE